MKKSRTKSTTSLICPDTKQFASIVVCAVNCPRKCDLYMNPSTYQVLVEFIEKHPEYEIIGELMARKTTTKALKKDSDVKEKLYWVIDDENKYVEVPESEILSNPSEYFGKKVWDKPPYEYDIIVSLKKKRA